MTIGCRLWLRNISNWENITTVPCREFRLFCHELESLKVFLIFFPFSRRHDHVEATLTTGGIRNFIHREENSKIKIVSSFSAIKRSFVINGLNNKTIIMLNFSEYILVLGQFILRPCWLTIRRFAARIHRIIVKFRCLFFGGGKPLAYNFLGWGREGLNLETCKRGWELYASLFISLFNFHDHACMPSCSFVPMSVEQLNLRHGEFQAVVGCSDGTDCFLYDKFAGV